MDGFCINIFVLYGELVRHEESTTPNHYNIIFRRAIRRSFARCGRVSIAHMSRHVTTICAPLCDICVLHIHMYVSEFMHGRQRSEDELGEAPGLNREGKKEARDRRRGSPSFTFLHSVSSPLAVGRASTTVRYYTAGCMAMSPV